MKIKSLMNQNGEWRPIEVEVSLRKGISAVKFLGLPDTVAKESVERIKPAFANLDIPWPNSKIITVNLRPTYLKKCSKGLDLPIALGILTEMAAFEDLNIQQDKYYYGELDLQGKVHMPEDLKQFLPLDNHVKVVSGITDEDQYCEITEMKALNQFEGNVTKPAAIVHQSFRRPNQEELLFDKATARLLKILAVGEHHTLIAGPAGSGKTTVAHALRGLLKSPTEPQARSIQRMQARFGKKESWRPFVHPHHTTPVISMLGGSVPVTPGELSRAHGGILLLDEFLEFGPQVLEALREPLEQGFMITSRRGVTKKFQANFQLIATTNLCPCGKFVPGKPANCRFSLRKCRGTIERLSGPLLDRFDILAYSDTWIGEKSESIPAILAELDKVYDFQESRGAVLPNRSLQVKELMPYLHTDFEAIGLPQVSSSQRRKRALLRVSRTLADLDQSESILIRHVQEANRLTGLSFYELEKM